MGWPSAANKRRVSTEGAEKIAAALPHIEDYATAIFAEYCNRRMSSDLWDAEKLSGALVILTSAFGEAGSHGKGSLNTALDLRETVDTWTR